MKANSLIFCFLGFDPLVDPYMKCKPLNFPPPPFECNENQIESHLLLWEQQATNLRLRSASQRGAEAPPEPAELVSGLRPAKWIGGKVDRKKLCKVDRKKL